MNKSEHLIIKKITVKKSGLRKDWVQYSGSPEPTYRYIIILLWLHHHLQIYNKNTLSVRTYSSTYSCKNNRCLPIYIIIKDKLLGNKYIAFTYLFYLFSGWNNNCLAKQNPAKFTPLFPLPSPWDGTMRHFAPDTIAHLGLSKRVTITHHCLVIGTDCSVVHSEQACRNTNMWLVNSCKHSIYCYVVLVLQVMQTFSL